MNQNRVGVLLDYVHGLAGAPRHSLTDQDLLDRFIDTGDEESFETLVRRLGPLVRNVCLRILGEPADADDAFQATFLVLARRASSIRRRQALGPWLYGVAQRIARRAQQRKRSRAVHEAKAVSMRSTFQSAEDMPLRELRLVLDEELASLPQKYRAPLILCCLEGKTRDEAADDLGWSIGSLKGRLERGRELLRSRLARRGLAVSSTLFVLLLPQSSATAAVPGTLSSATLRTVVGVAKGRTLASLVTPQVLTMVHSFLAKTVLTRVIGTSLLALCLGLGGVGTVSQDTPNTPAVPASTSSAPVAVERPPVEPVAEAATSFTPDMEMEMPAVAKDENPAELIEEVPPLPPPEKHEPFRRHIEIVVADGFVKTQWVTSKNGEKHVETIATVADNPSGHLKKAKAKPSQPD